VAGGQESPEEKFARHLVADLIGARSEHGDGPGAPSGMVDAWLTYPDGRRAALETTWASDGSEFQLRTLLRQHGEIQPAPGMWTWSVQVAGPAEFPRVARIAERVILIMESYKALDLWSVPHLRVDADADLRWARDESESIFSPHSEPPTDSPRILWTPRIVVAFLGTDADALAEGIALELKSDNTGRHITKLLGHDAVERHLFILASQTGLSEAANFALVNASSVPSAEPDLPAGISDLWIHSGFGLRLIHWRRGRGWALVGIPRRRSQGQSAPHKPRTIRGNQR
jgi:hypothetical protein